MQASDDPQAKLQEARAFSEELLALSAIEDARLQVGEVVRAFGDKAFGAIMLVVALINFIPLPPGGTTLTGAPLVLLSLQLALGREHLWLPKGFMRASIPRTGFRKGVAKASPLIKFAEKLSAPRLAFLVGPFGQRVIGVVCLLLSIELVLPIPLGNIVPAAAIALFSLGVMQRDGIAVLLGGAGAGASAFLLMLVWRTVVGFINALIDRLPHLAAG
jgi:hypothetical protein